MKKKSTYFLPLALLFIISLNCAAQDYYQPAVYQGVNDNPHKIILAPNPVSSNSYFNLLIDSAKETYTAKLLIYDWSGNILQHQILQIQPGNNVFQINIGGYEQGNYVVRITGEKNTLFSRSLQLVVR